MTKIEETLKRIAGATSKVPSQNSSSINFRSQSAGDPNCPICGGVGFVRRDLPIEHPDFGKVEICQCRQSQVSQAVRQRLFRLSNLDALSNLTFETFKSRGRVGLSPLQADTLESAFSHARQFAGSLKGWLLMLGSYGCGKTHLAAAIANFAVSMSIPTLFLTVPDLLDWLRFSYESSETSFEERFEEIRTIGLLVLDDFGTQNATPWAQEKLFQIFNYRYINRLPLVVTSNQTLDDIEDRIRSRLKDPELVTTVRILAPDYRNPKEDSSHPELSSLSFMGQKTFGNFSLRQGEGIPGEDLKTLESAYKAAEKFSQHPTGWIVFSGAYGCGKTHLAAAIGNYRANSGYPPMFVVVPDLLDHLRATFSPTSNISYDRRFEEVRTSPLLILDDLGTQSATPWAREKIYQLFNYRYNAELPTVITTSDLIDDIDPRVRSRMMDSRLCEFHGITVPAFRGTSRKGDVKPVRRTRRTGV